VSERKIAYFSLPTFILLLSAGTTALNFSVMNATFTRIEENAFITTAVYAQSNANNVSSGLKTDLATQQFATDVSGHYSNPAYGISDFVISSGWYGSEKQRSGDKSISLDMHPGTEAEYMDRLLNPPSLDGNNENDPTMILELSDKAQLQYSKSLLGEMPPVAETAPADQCKSLGGSICFLEPNSTATIDGKVFNVFTMEYKWETDQSNNEMQIENLNDSLSGSTSYGSSTEVSKTYRYESPERIYSLQLKVSKDLYDDSQNISQNAIDIEKYTPIIDTAVRTLKIE
jgi:hypothetical protein